MSGIKLCARGVRARSIEGINADIAFSYLCRNFPVIVMIYTQLRMAQNQSQVYLCQHKSAITVDSKPSLWLEGSIILEPSLWLNIETVVKQIAFNI